MNAEETNMASIFKRNKRKKNEPWWIQYTDHLGKRKTAKGFTWEAAAKQVENIYQDLLGDKR